MLFRDCKYTKWYNDIIASAKIKNRKKSQNYYENHHIVPKSIGGTNEKQNMVLLTAREHYICHLLLPEMVLSKNEKQKMIYALNRLANSTIIRSRTYERLRRKHAELVSLRHKGKILSEETKNKISQSRIGVKIIRTQEHNDKIGLAQKGIPRLYARGRGNVNCKGIIQQLDDCGNVIREYVGISELLEHGFTTGVYYAISGKYKSHRGYKWRFKDAKTNN